MTIEDIHALQKDIFEQQIEEFRREKMQEIEEFRQSRVESTQSSRSKAGKSLNNLAKEKQLAEKFFPKALAEINEVITASAQEGEEVATYYLSDSDIFQDEDYSEICNLYLRLMLVEALTLSGYEVDLADGEITLSW